MPEAGTDFVDGLVTMMANRDPADLEGVAVHIYRANADMADRYFFDADGELLIIPEQGRLDLRTEMGRIEIAPGEVALIPRGVRFRVLLPDGAARGYVAENHGALFRLPELGPIGVERPRQPARLPDARRPPMRIATARFELIQKHLGALWVTELDHSPLDVVAWHGNLAPWKYDLALFNTIGTVSYDHPDPSIFTVLTSPSDVPGRANADFVIFPPRWMVAEDTFRPPWFHRNVMSECMGLITGAYDAKAEGFAPGGMSLHNLMAGPRAGRGELARRASEAELKPHKIEGTMAFMVESCWPYRPTRFALDHAQPDYDEAWDGFPKAELPPEQLTSSFQRKLESPAFQPLQEAVIPAFAGMTNCSAPLRQERLHAARGLAEALLVLDQGDADVALPFLAEADARARPRRRPRRAAAWRTPSSPDARKASGIGVQANMLACGRRRSPSRRGRSNRPGSRGAPCRAAGSPSTMSCGPLSAATAAAWIGVKAP